MFFSNLIILTPHFSLDYSRFNIFSSNISHPITGTLTNINNVPSLFIVKSAL